MNPPDNSDAVSLPDHPLLDHDPTAIVCWPEHLDAARRLLGSSDADTPVVVEPLRE